MTTSKNQKILTDAHNDFATGLSRYARLKCGDRALSDDLVQATFMKTWLYLQKTGKIDLMRAFLYHVLNDLIVDEYRKYKPLSLDLLAESGFELKTIVSEDIFNIIDGKALTLLIKKLPVKYRAVITMRYVNELSFKEMSVLTKETQSTLSVQVHRGLAKLRRLSTASARSRPSLRDPL
jgi:RNA polymerase sigma-70 factor, ECF subfamily